MTDPDIRDIAAWCKAEARKGATALHLRAAGTKAPKLTDAESAAIARKRLDEEGKR